jgi:hypothetical protein
MLTPAGLTCDHCGGTVAMDQLKLGWHTVGEPALPSYAVDRFVARLDAVIHGEHFDAYRPLAVRIPHILHFCCDACFRDWWELAIEGRLAQQKEEAAKCPLCGDAFGSRDEYDREVVRLAPDSDFCRRCASGAAYRELRQKQAEAHRAERARRGDR